MVIWVVGPSGAGKSTLARELVARWRERGEVVVLVDGDELRAVFEADRSPADYSMAGRRANADRLAAITAWLDGQGVHVVAAVMLLFDEVSQRNRDQLSSYFEVAIAAPFEQLEQRDVKGLYAAARAGRERNVVGVDLPWTATTAPDLRIENDGEEPDWTTLADRVLTEAGVA